jgi:hypothetical protein
MRTRIGPGPNPSSAFGGRLKSAGCGREGDEEGIALRIDLETAVLVEGLAKGAAVKRERLRVALRAELIEQPRRSLDVGNEERHRSGKKLCHPGSSEASRTSAVQRAIGVDNRPLR